MKRYFVFLTMIIHNILGFSVLNNRIIDNYKREVIFHGANVVVKLPPCHPNIKEFNYNSSFNNDDINIISNYGLNFIRLGVMWSCVEPNKGEYNYTYLDIMKNIVSNLDNNNIFVLIEFHQDALSEYFCGEGIPDWAAENSDFPIPISLPYNKTGKPSKIQCLSKDWWEYQFSIAAQDKYKELYSDTTLRSSFLNYWNITAFTFNNSKNVIGYEFMNEPFVPINGLLPHDAASKYLVPFYEAGFNMMKSRGYLNNKLFLFEPVTWSDFGSGFTSPPGNDHTKNVLSYHCYFPPQISVSQLFRARLNDMDKLNIGGFLTELGSNRILEVFEYTDQFFQSWSVWSYKRYSGITGDGSMFFEKNGSNASTRQYLERIYPRALCGHGIYFNYNVTNNSFLLTYKNIPDCESRSEIYLLQSINHSTYNIKIIPFANYSIINNILYILPYNDSIIITVNGYY